MLNAKITLNVIHLSDNIAYVEVYQTLQNIVEMKNSAQIIQPFMDYVRTYANKICNHCVFAVNLKKRLKHIVVIQNIVVFLNLNAFVTHSVQKIIRRILAFVEYILLILLFVTLFMKLVLTTINHKASVWKLAMLKNYQIVHVALKMKDALNIKNVLI